jgi:hypothetical protein
MQRSRRVIVLVLAVAAVFALLSLPGVGSQSQAATTPTSTATVSPAASTVPSVVIPVPATSGPGASGVTDNGANPSVKPSPAPVRPAVRAPLVTPPVDPPPPAPAPRTKPKARHKSKRKVKHIQARRPAAAPRAARTGAAGVPATPAGPVGSHAYTRGSAPPTVHNLPVYRPAAHVKSVLSVTVGGVAVIGGLAAALGGGVRGLGGGSGGGGGDGGGGGGGGGGRSDGAFLEDVETEREAMAKRGRGRGDRSRTWWWPSTRHVDRFSKRYPSRLAAISPIAGRVSVDADYLRAMFGGLWLLLYPLAIVLGVLAAANTGYAAIPPALGWFVAVLAIGMFDSMAGYVAGISFGIAVLLGGGIVDAASVREVFGIVLVWFATPLAAGAVRPLRRNTRLQLPGMWDRAADFVLAGLFGGWLAAKMTESLSALGGIEVPLAKDKWTIALIVIGLVAARMIVETFAAHHYPDRLQAVAHEGDLESGNLQVGLSLVIQVALFIFIARAFMKWDWPLFAGTLLFYLPLVPWLFVDRLPKSSRVAKWMPLGLAKWSFVIVTGVLLSWMLDHLVHDPAQAEAFGFIFLPLPILVCWGLELFVPEEEEEEEAAHAAVALHGTEAAEHAHVHTHHPEEEEGRFPMTWRLRFAGVPVLLLCTWLVLGGIAGG